MAISASIHIVLAITRKTIMQGDGHHLKRCTRELATCKHFLMSQPSLYQSLPLKGHASCDHSDPTAQCYLILVSGQPQQHNLRPEHSSKLGKALPLAILILGIHFLTCKLTTARYLYQTACRTQGKEGRASAPWGWSAPSTQHGRHDSKEAHQQLANLQYAQFDENPKVISWTRASRKGRTFFFPLYY